MTSFLSTLKQRTDQLARVVGHVIIRLTLVVGVALALVWVGSAMGADDTAPAPTTTVLTPTVGTPGEGVSTGGASTGGTSTATSASSGADRPLLVGLRSTEVTAAAWQALQVAGWKVSRVADHGDVIYAPLNTVLADDGGTWTVTVDGLARCEHGSERKCTGEEWLR